MRLFRFILRPKGTIYRALFQPGKRSRGTYSKLSAGNPLKENLFY
jgi:hypothetical protein